MMRLLDRTRIPRALAPIGMAVLATLGSSAGHTQDETTERRRPNVVIVLSDDHRWDVMGCNGNDYIPTPNMDRMAAEGADFANAFATSGLCSPSRASILTGRYCHEVGVPRVAWMNHTFHRQETSFFARLQSAGYHTAHVGKWHLGRGHEPKPGYDHWASFEWLGEFFDPVLWIDGEEKRFEGFTDDVLSELAADHIRKRAKEDGPFALFVGLKSPHLDFCYPPRHEDAFDDVSIPKPPTYDEDRARSGKAVLARTRVDIDDFFAGLPQFGTWDRYVESYYKSSLAIDDALGRILDAIDEAGIAEDTFVLYTSDHGYSLGDHGLTEKYYAYEGSMRVPLLVRYPRSIPAASRPEEMVLNIDIAPTVLDLCDVPVAEEMRGASWIPLAESDADTRPDWRDEFLFDQTAQGAGTPSHLAVRTDRYKLIHYPDYSPIPRELYDLEEDPLEAKSVVDDPAYAEVLADMEARLERLVEETGWLPRGLGPIPFAWVLGPVPPDALDEVRAAVLALPPDMEGAPIDAKGRTFEWRRAQADESSCLPLGASASAPAGHRSFLAMPIGRRIDRDPYVQLHHAPERQLRLFVNGEQTESGIQLGHMSAVLNPPLPARDNLVVLEIDPGPPEFIQIVLEAPQGILILPE